MCTTTHTCWRFEIFHLLPFHLPQPETGYREEGTSFFTPQKFSVFRGSVGQRLLSSKEFRDPKGSFVESSLSLWWIRSILGILGSLIYVLTCSWSIREAWPGCWRCLLCGLDQEAFSGPRFSFCLGLPEIMYSGSISFCSGFLSQAKALPQQWKQEEEPPSLWCLGFSKPTHGHLAHHTWQSAEVGTLMRRSPPKKNHRDLMVRLWQRFSHQCAKGFVRVPSPGRAPFFKIN